MNTTSENEESKKWIDMIDQPQKVTVIDTQIRLVREVDSSIEHVAWFVDIDVTDLVCSATLFGTDPLKVCFFYGFFVKRYDLLRKKYGRKI